MSVDFNLIGQFSGDGSQDAQLWLTRFQLMAVTKNLNDNKAKATLPLLLKENALRWYVALPQHVKDNYAELKREFIIRYGPDERVQWQRTASLYQTAQGSGESVEDYVSGVTSKGAELNLPEEQLRNIVLNGLRPHLRQFVLQQNPATLDDMRKSAKLAELTLPDTAKEQQSVATAIARLESKLELMSVAQASALQPTTYSPENRGYQTTGVNHNQNRYPQQHEAENYYPQPENNFYGPPQQPNYGYIPQESNRGYRPNGSSRGTRNQQYRQPAAAQGDRRGPYEPYNTCNWCGGQQTHSRDRCPARGKLCNKCGKINHFARACRSVPRDQQR